MLDIIGIGSLNLDLVVTADKIKTLPADKVNAALAILAHGAERLVERDDLQQVLSLLGPASFRATLGGSAFNTICAVAALPAGIKTGYVGVAGRAENSGLDFTTTMQALAVDHRYVRSCPEQGSGLCISVNHGGVRSFLFHPGANNKMLEYLRANYQDILQYLLQAKMLHVTQFTDERISAILARLLGEAKKSNPALRISCDPGYCWLKNLSPAVGDIISLADFLFLNEIEFNVLCGGRNDASDGEKARMLFSRYGWREGCLIIKKASEIRLYHGNCHNLTAARDKINVLPEAEIVDATGAGDIFAAGFLTGWLLCGRKTPEAVALGMHFMRAKLLLPPDRLYPELAGIFSRNIASFDI